METVSEKLFVLKIFKDGDWGFLGKETFTYFGEGNLALYTRDQAIPMNKKLAVYKEASLAKKACFVSILNYQGDLE